MTDCLAVTLDTIVMDGTADADGILWVWRELPGWWEGGTPDGDVYARLTANGGVFGEAWQRERHVAVIGTASVPLTEVDPVEKMLVARRKLTEAVDVSDTSVLSVDEGTALGVLRLTVRQDLQLRFPPQRSTRALEFEIPVVSEDWRKVSATLTQTTVGLGGLVTNLGNAPATPSLRIAGDSAANVGVTNVTTGETISTTLNLGPADVLVIDCATGTATLNGVDTTASLALGSRFFDLAVGANTVNLVNGGTASLRVDYRKSYR